MAKTSSLFFSMFICFILISLVAFAPSAESQAMSCDYDQAQAIARENCKGQDTSFCAAKCQGLSTALVVVASGCEQNPADETNYYCVCCYALDICDAGSWLSSFSPKLLFKGLGQ
ncbi:hypothetical protein C5167_034376 [Papaver somniferum]|uniref:Knottin scorpion toxin-like domain-containing protein n=1 Tax=Papaver somniferum TaxID=3469 RepID=A0A4Y7KGM8_PAPSO|nr:uncharacterized protein LOC113299358 [Papaver somniferum]RZC71208.1 hypothetical protein C5167_034376 [Papaver somniferum]